MTDYRKYRHHWIFCAAALAAWLGVGWPMVDAILGGTKMRGFDVPDLWLVPFAVFGAAVFAAIVPTRRPGVERTLLCVQVAAVVAMAILVPSATVPVFLVIVAWQVAMTRSTAAALGWVAVQTTATIGALAHVQPDFEYCFIFGLSFALQLFFVFTAHALRMEAETARALARTIGELRSAQAVIANAARDAERLRISRELHDAWGHELTALGLQLEIASHVIEPGRARDNVMQARGLARDLMARVRDVVSALREAERGDLKEALEALAQNVPTPTIHIDVAPDLRVGPSQTHALIRCAQEAVTNAVKHADASNLWLRVTPDGEGVRLMARNDGTARPAAAAPGSGLLGMRERLEHLGGRLAVRSEVDLGFTVDAWLPSGAPKAA